MKRFQLSLWVCLVVCFGFSTYAQDTKEIIILQTSDVHSRIEPINQKGDRNYDEGGFVRRATFLDQFRKEHKNVLLFDCGDISQGTPLLFKMAKFPVVCSNYNLDATVLKDLVKPYVILKRFGLKIGVFGLGAKPEGLIQANKCVGVVYEDPIEVSNKVAALLKEKGCDLVVCLSHLGIQMDRELVAKTRNIDVILGGHSHTFMKGPENYQNVDGKEVPVMHTGKSGVRVGRLNLTLKRK